MEFKWCKKFEKFTMFEDNFDIFNSDTNIRIENMKQEAFQEEPIDEKLKTHEELNAIKKMVFEEIKKKHENQLQKTRLNEKGIKKKVSNKS